MAASPLSLLLLLPLSAKAQPGSPSAPQPAAVSSAAVTLGGLPVMVLRARPLSLSADERAQRVSERLRKISRDPLADADRISVAEGDGASDIALDDFVIMSVTDRDARASGLTRQELAQEYAGVIRQAVLTYRGDYSFRALLSGSLYALLLTAGFLAALRLLGHFYNSYLPRLNAWAQGSVKSITIQNIELVNAGYITGLLNGFMKAARLLATLLLLYFYVPVLLSFFPWTRSFTPVLFGYLLDPVASLFWSFVGYVPNLIFVAVTVIVVHYLLSLLRALAEEVHCGHVTFNGFYADWSRPTFQIIRFLVWAFTLVLVFPYLPGSHSPAFKGVSVFLGVLFSLGSTSAIANVVAGIMLTYMRPFKPGDRVKIAETVGDITERSLLVTRIKTIKNINVTVPNSLVLGSHIVNYSSLSEKEGIILNTTVTIGYDAPWVRVHELLLGAAAATAGILKEPKPFILQTALNDYNVSYELNAYTGTPAAMARIYSDLHANIQDQFNAAGVEIMSPAYMGLRDANAPARPGPAKPAAAAAFKVNIGR